MKFNLKFLTPFFIFVPFIEADPAVVLAPNYEFYVTVDEFPDGPFHPPVPTVHKFVVRGVEQPFKGGHNGLVSTGDPTILLEEIK